MFGRQPGEGAPRRRAGAFIGLVGPDGSGKTTVAAEIERQCNASGREFAYVHWRPSLRHPFRRPSPSATPLPKNPALEHVTAIDRMASLVRLLRSALTFNVSYVTQLRPRLRSGAVIVVDRWIYNYISQPDSVRYYGSPRFATFVCARLVAHPSPVFVLEAPTSVILARSDELNDDAVQAEYQRFRDRLPLADLRWIDATSDPAEIAEHILAECRLTSARTD